MKQYKRDNTGLRVEPIEEQEVDLSDLDEPVHGPVVIDEDADKERAELLFDYNAVRAAEEETKAQYEEIKCLREEAERSLSETRGIINLANDTYNLLSKEDGFARLELSSADERLSNVYAREIRRYVELLKCEDFLRFALSTSVFEDGEIGYIVNDHITFVLKLERS